MPTDTTRPFSPLPPPRYGKWEGARSVVAPVLLYGTIAFLLGWSIWPDWYYVKNSVILAFSLFALWRYGWLAVNYVRALIYNQVVYPRLQREAQARPLEERYPQRVFFMIPSFKEEPWISLECMHSVLGSLAEVPCHATIIVATGSDQDDAVVSAAFQSHPARMKAELVLQRQSEGKRIAMGHALRAISRRYDDEVNCVTIFMDGDSRLEAQALKRILPLFCANPRLGAATSNEVAYLMDKTPVTRQWFDLKMGQRHVLFQSHSLSRRVLTLTGRFSLIRTSIITSEQFIRQIENDHLVHWMHGRFRFLMGDDKSTWFQLLKDRWEMLYVPDVICYSLESRVTPFAELSLSLPYRWYGNTLRNNSRALALGPRKTGWFIWAAILDQRLTMWTALVGITGSLVLAIFVSYIYLPFYLAWAILVRTMQLSVIASSGHRVGMWTVPLMFYNQWVGACVKMHAFFHLSRQRWFKGSAKQGSAAQAKGARAQGTIRSPLAGFMPNFHMGISIVAFLFTMLLTHHVLRLPDLRLLHRESPVYEVAAVQRGVWPDDGTDDALALQSILDSLPADKPAIIRLPEGRLDFKRPIHITGSNITLQGAGEGQTTLVSHLRTGAGAVVTVAGRRGPLVGRLKLAAESGHSHLNVETAQVLVPGDLLQVTAPNSEQFLNELGSTVWRQTAPHLRQELTRVIRVEGQVIYLEDPLLDRYAAARTEIYHVRPSRNVILRGFSMTQALPDAPTGLMGLPPLDQDNQPEYAVDGILLNWTSQAQVDRVRLTNVGRHPLVVDNSADFRVADCWLDGSLNSGEMGGGSVQILRSHHGLLTALSLRQLRHLTFGWSSSRNRAQGITTSADIHFAGGYSRHNQLEEVEFITPENLTGGTVTRTPTDSPAAPPDGPGNIVKEKAPSTKRPSLAMTIKGLITW